MLINKDISNKDIVNYLTILGFEYIIDDAKIERSYYEYNGLYNYNLKIVFDVGVVIAVYNKEDIFQRLYYKETAIDYLNATFKHIFRKHKINKLLNTNE